MKLIVQKFGGTSVRDRDRIFNVAKIITDTYKEGNNVIAVVSAQGDTTDDLIAKAEEINPNAKMCIRDRIPGKIDKIVCPYKIPHMGWNSLEITRKSPLLKGVSEGESVYFVHSFMAYTEGENISAQCDYGVKVPALVERGNVFGAQFHPEKSGEVGLQILRNFGDLTKR